MLHPFWCEYLADVALKRYLDSLSPRSRVNRRSVLDRFFGFVGESASMAIEFQRDNPSSYRYVDLAYNWLSRSGITVSTKRTQMGSIRGLFIVNRCPLPADRHRFRSEVVPVVGDLTVDELRQIIIASNVTYRAAFLVAFQGGCGVGELCYINAHHADYVFDEVRNGRQIIRLSLPGRKQQRNIYSYYSYVGSDAVEALRQLFYSRGWKRDNVLFRNERGEPVSGACYQTYFRSMALKLGLIKRKNPSCLDCGGETVRKRSRITGRDLVYYICVSCQSERPASDYGRDHKDFGSIRYRMKTHEIRDLFRTEFHRAQTYAGADANCANFFMGHSIDPLKYDKIMRDKKYALEQYRKALPWLNILSEDPRKIDRSEVSEELETQRVETELLKRELAKLKRDREGLDDLLELLRDPEKLRKFKRLIEKE